MYVRARPFASPLFRSCKKTTIMDYIHLKACYYWVCDPFHHEGVPLKRSD